MTSGKTSWNKSKSWIHQLSLLKTHSHVKKTTYFTFSTKRKHEDIAFKDVCINDGKGHLQLISLAEILSEWRC